MVYAHVDCCKATRACVFCMFLCTRRMLLRGDACMCWSVCLGLYKAHAHSDCCKAMHSCMYVYQCMTKVYCHCDCCEAMHACVRVCVWVCTRHMLTVIAVLTVTCVCTHMHTQHTRIHWHLLQSWSFLSSKMTPNFDVYLFFSQDCFKTRI
jgi:hypothetical protein